jgi:hypothetical protein
VPNARHHQAAEKLRDLRHLLVAAQVDGVVIRAHLESRMITSPRSTSSIGEK